jgi:RNA polymerase sigma-70 factor (ECF subfamily)
MQLIEGSTMERKDPQIVTYQFGDPATWVDKYGDYLFRYALCFVRDRDLAEDLVQETFLAALQSYGSFGQRSSEKAWLFGILKHKALDHYRKHERLSHLVMDETESPDVFIRKGSRAGFWRSDRSPKDWSFDPENCVEQRALRAILDDCLDRLSPRLAMVFRLREIEQVKGKVICSELNITENNLWVMLHRARLCLRNCIEINWLNRK